LDLKQKNGTLFRDFWDARIYLLDDEHDLTTQYLRKKLAYVTQQPYLWDWQSYPEKEKVNRLIKRFISWLLKKKAFYNVNFSNSIPEIKFKEAVAASTKAGYDVLANSFFNRWQGLLQYETIGKFIQTIPRKDNYDHPPKLLDAGCGPGFYAKVFNALGFDCYAIDNSTVMIEYANEYLGHTIIFADHGPVEKIKLLQSSLDGMKEQFNGTFSAIWYSAVILHLPRIMIASVLAKLSELLIPSGILYFSFREDKGAEIRQEGRAFFFYTLEEILKFVKQSGCWTVLNIWDGQTNKGTIHRDTRVKKWKHLLLEKTATKKEFK
jgi:2-polyprenyl-3-methyl-5-hydroxy-6-metoxy-1,4-benzoquinol methylase